MLTLRKAQSLFVQRLADLLDYGLRQGYEFTLGEGFVSSHTGHMDGSLHYEKLAQDLNLFVNGKWVVGDHPAWHDLGQFWESLGGSWGGRFASRDYNHFSLAWGGRKLSRKGERCMAAKAHPGFKAVQSKIARQQQGVSKERAGAILASQTRKASPAAKRANPRLNRVKG